MLLSSLSYRDPQTGITWQQSMNAARVVPMGYRGLPAAKAQIQFLHLSPGKFPQPRHPLQDVYPGIDVRYYAMQIDFENMAEEVNGKKGIAFWHGNNGSGFCASVTSEFGRSNVAPLAWEGESARAQPYWDWRTADGHLWTNARQHGFPGFSGEHRGLDWLDGAPEDVATMYDPEQAVVRQTVIVPKRYGIGTAQQTLEPDDLVETYSVMLYFPRTDRQRVWEKLQNFPNLMTEEQARQRFSRREWRGADDDLVLRGGPSLYGDSIEKGVTLGLESAEVEITHANELRQHIVMPVMDPGLWRLEPTAVIVCFPTTPAQIAELNRPTGVGRDRRGFTW